MCEISFDDGDYETFSVWEDRYVKRARKQHACETCDSTIEIGSPYLRHFSVTGGNPSSEAQCLPCRAIAKAFGDAHNFRASPSYFFTVLSNCIDEGDPLSAIWVEGRDAITRRRIDARQQRAS